MAVDKERIRAHALALGFDVVGFASAVGDAADRERLARFLADDRQGDMAWLAREPEKRADPSRLWPGARSIVCLGVNYGPDGDPLAGLGEAGVGVISVYARRRDYHLVLKKKLKRLGGWLVDTFGGAVKVFVDTAPVMEKPLAARAGLGWIGKHTNLVSRRFGSWLFLGEVFTTLSIEPDPPASDACGRCERCVKACPTGAIDRPYRLDPRRCISYLTIEHKGEIGPDLAAALGNRLFGCDDCLAVCPWNKFGRASAEADLALRRDLDRLPLAPLADLDEAAFRARFATTPVRRAGRVRLQQVAGIAATNQRVRPSACTAPPEMPASSLPTWPPEPAPAGSTPRDGGHSESA